MTHRHDGTTAAYRSDLISIVLPAYNEAQNIRPIFQGIAVALRQCSAIEVIFVDDGSYDETACIVRQLRKEGAPVRLIRFGRNFGHQAALFAGIERSRGCVVITLDCDLQHPPEFLPRMLEEWSKGAKIVQMIRTETVGASLFKRVSSKCFYHLLNFLSDVPVPVSGADFQLLDRQVVEVILQFKDRSPFLRGLVSWTGFPSTRMEYVAAPRFAGSSAYGFRKMLWLSVQAVTGLSSKPLRFSFYLGMFAATVSLVYAVFAIIEHVVGITVPGWTSVIIVVTFLGAVQLLSVGVLGEYIARIYEQSRAMPRSVVVECDENIPPASSQAPIV